MNDYFHYRDLYYAMIDRLDHAEQKWMELRRSDDREKPILPANTQLHFSGSRPLNAEICGFATGAQAIGATPDPEFPEMQAVERPVCHYQCPCWLNEENIYDGEDEYAMWTNMAHTGGFIELDAGDKLLSNPENTVFGDMQHVCKDMVQFGIHLRSGMMLELCRIYDKIEQKSWTVNGEILDHFYTCLRSGGLQHLAGNRSLIIEELSSYEREAQYTKWRDVVFEHSISVNMHFNDIEGIENKYGLENKIEN